jgi:hypothetical protein
VPHDHKVAQRTSDKDKFRAFAVEQGFGMSMWPRGAHFDATLYDPEGNRFLIAILGDCWTINSLYIGRSDIWLVFRIGEELYWMPHDEVVTAAEADGFSSDSSWMCSPSRPSPSMRARCAPYRIGPEPGEFWLANRGWALRERYRSWADSVQRAAKSKPGCAHNCPSEQPFRRKQMRVVPVHENDYEDDAVQTAHWRGPREDIFEAIDDQLEAFGLEIVMIDSGGSDFMWRIQRCSE